MHSHSLTDVLNRCRQAVLGARISPEKNNPIHREQFTEPVSPVVRPYRPFAEASTVQGGKALSRGAQRLWTLLHDLAVQTALERNYSHRVSQVVFSLPQSLAAAALDYTDRHVRNLQLELEQAGLLATHALASHVKGKNLWATTLWAVKVGSERTTPHLTPDDFGHSWRDLETDFLRRNTAQRLISGLKDIEESKRIFVLFHVIVTGLFTMKPRYSSSTSEIRLNTAQEAIYQLGSLAETASPTVVAALASTLATSLNDGHSFRWWCKQLWRIAGSWESIGEIQAKLHRILADLREFEGIRNPGSWANSRLAKAV